MDRIAIIGLQGAGKSTFAYKLGKKLHRHVTHLDKEYFLPNWERRYTREEWVKYQKNLVKQKQWIIEGNYKSTIDIRLEAADAIIFFDFPILLCIFRTFKRVLNKEQPSDKVEGMREKVGIKLILAILTYPRENVLKKLESYKTTKKIIIFRKINQVDEYLKNW